MIEWIPVNESSRIVAEAYDPDAETIFVRFPDGTEWFYSACSRATWEEFSAPGQSRGLYIAHVLNAKQNARWDG